MLRDKIRKTGVPEKYVELFQNKKQSVGCLRLIEDNKKIIKKILCYHGQHLYIEHNEVSNAELATEFAVSILIIHLANNIPIKTKLNYLFTPETLLKDFDFSKYYNSDLLLFDSFKINEYQAQALLPIIGYRFNHQYNTIFVSPQDSKALPKSIWALVKANCEIIKI